MADVEKVVTLKIFEEGSFIIMEVINQVTEKIPDIDKILLPGFTTKEGSHNGMGLYNCQQLAKKIHASVVCLNEPQNEIRFSLVIPKMKEMVSV